MNFQFKALSSLFALFLAISIFSPSKVIAYPEDQLKQCILGAKRNPVVLGVPSQSIENWCDCVLELIIDEGKEDILSANQCGKKFFK